MTYFPIFQGPITHFANPALEAALASAPVTVIADPAECSFQFNPVGIDEVHELVRHREVGAGRPLGELPERGGAGGHDGRA